MKVSVIIPAYNEEKYIGKLLRSLNNQTIKANEIVVVDNNCKDKTAVIAKTVVLAGVLGKYEDEGHSQGTQKVFSAVAASSAFKIVGGGDSLAAIQRYNLEDKFNWISVGGGAMLEFLTKKSLPGIEALLNK